jgi:hypothetical protein
MHKKNPIKESYKTHICHSPLATWRKDALMYSWAGHTFFSLKQKFV